MVCGHIHSAVIKEVEGVTYINCGDWVDSCTAIVEHWSGSMELIEWNGHCPDTQLLWGGEEAVSRNP